MTIHRGRRKAIAQLISVSGGVALGIPRVTFAQPAKPASIVVNAAGGAVNKGLREAFFIEFEKRYGIKVVDTSPTDFGKLRAMVQSGNVEWSVMEINEADAERAVKLNLLEPLDMSVINMSGHPKELQDKQVGGHAWDLFDGAGLPHRRVRFTPTADHVGRILGRQKIPRAACAAQFAGR